MGDWWIDETPYPGPKESDLRDALRQIGAAFAETGRRYGRGIRQLAAVVEKMQGFGYSAQEFNGHWHFFVDPATPFVPTTTAPGEPTDPKERALWLKKNQNKGPYGPDKYNLHGKRRY